MNTSLFKISLILFFLTVVVSSSPVDNVLKNSGHKCVSFVFDENFEAAHKEADALIKKMPKSPAGYFLKAAVYHHQMKDLGTNAYVTQLYAACDQGLKIGESSTGEWDRFFCAAVLGIRGAYERNQNRLVTSLKLGWRAIEIFRPLKDQGNIDAVYGVAVYDYWVGANVKALFWMEDAKDERPRALEDLLNVSQNGVFTSQVVLYDLLEMYADEKKYAKVASIAKKILVKYPSNTVAFEYLFWAQYKQGNYLDAKISLAQREVALNARKAPAARLKKMASDAKLISGK